MSSGESLRIEYDRPRVSDYNSVAQEKWSFHSRHVALIVNPARFRSATYAREKTFVMRYFVLDSLYCSNLRTYDNLCCSIIRHFTFVLLLFFKRLRQLPSSAVFSVTARMLSIIQHQNLEISGVRYAQASCKTVSCLSVKTFSLSWAGAERLFREERIHSKH